MSLEVNKAFAAVLTAGITFMVAGLVGNIAVHPKRTERAAIATGEVQAAAAPTPAALDPIAPLLAAANAENGRTLANRQCAACHTFNEGGRNAVGPNLYGVVLAPHARAPGFNYSPALRAKAADPWGYEELNAFLANPARAVPGTRMAFAGLNQASQRADVIAYLRTLDAAPKPLP